MLITGIIVLCFYKCARLISALQSVEDSAQPLKYYLRTDSGKYLQGEYGTSATQEGGGLVLTIVDTPNGHANLGFDVSGTQIVGKESDGNTVYTQLYCLDCRNYGSHTYCYTDMHICVKDAPNQAWTRNTGENGRFTISSSLNNSLCVTYVVQRSVSGSTQFQLRDCKSPASSNQKFYFEEIMYYLRTDSGRYVQGPATGADNLLHTAAIANATAKPSLQFVLNGDSSELRWKKPTVGSNGQNTTTDYCFTNATTTGVRDVAVADCSQIKSSVWTRVYYKKNGMLRFTILPDAASHPTQRVTYNSQTDTCQLPAGWTDPRPSDSQTFYLEIIPS